MRSCRIIGCFISLFALLPRAEAAPPLVVEASCASSGQVDPITLRRLMAWRKGHLLASPAGVPLLSLRVRRVIKGALPAAFVNPPTGVNLLEVVALDEAALAGVGLGNQGRWRLRRLPDGTLYVAAVADTPVKAKVSAHLSRLARIRSRLASKRPKMQYEGLRGLAKTVDYALVPAVLALLDSKAKVTNPRGMHFHGVSGGGYMPVDVVLGQEARRILADMLSPLRTRRSPDERAGAAVWRKWWRAVLATAPFPAVREAPGTLTSLAPLPLNQTWVQLAADPRGSAAVVALTRAYTPVHGARNVILYLPLTGARTARPVYRVPAKGPQWEPRGMRAAWGPGGAALVWHDERYVGGKSRRQQWFLALTREGKPRHKPVDLKLGSTGHMALAPLGRGWVVAYERRADRAFWVQRLGAAGQRVGPARRIIAPAVEELGFHLGVQPLAAAALPGGAAVAVGGEQQLTLVLLDKQGKVTRRQRVDDPGSGGSSFFPRLLRNGQRLCVAWRQTDNHDDRLLVRLHQLDGKPLTGPVVLAGHVDTVANIVPHGQGFGLTWAGHAQRPHQLRTRRVSAAGKPGPARVLAQRRARNQPLAAGALGGVLRLTFADSSSWPHRLMLKELKLR